MAVPKTTVDEDDFFESRKNDIGISREITLMQTESQSHPVNDFPDGYFRPCVPSRNSGHDPASFLSVEDVGHAFMPFETRSV